MNINKIRDEIIKLFKLIFYRYYMKNNLSNNNYIIFSLLLDKKYLLKNSISLYQYISLPLVCSEINIIFKNNFKKLLNIEILDEIILFSGLDLNNILICINDKKSLFANLDYLGDELLKCYYNRKIIHKNYYEDYINSLYGDKFYPLNKYIYKDYRQYKNLKKKIQSSTLLQLSLNNADKPNILINNLLNNNLL